MSTRDWPLDPTPAALMEEFPGWRVFRGVNDLCYARKILSSPQIILVDENTTELRAKLKAWTGKA